MKKEKVLFLSVVMLLLTTCSKATTEVDSHSVVSITTIEATEVVIIGESIEITEVVIPKESSDFLQWEGTWNSLDIYLDDPGLMETYRVLSEVEGTAVEDIKIELKAQYQSYITSMQIDGERIIVCEQTMNGEDNCDLPIEITYTYLEKIRHYSTDWYVFYTDSDVIYPVLMLTEVAQTEGGTDLPYFELRCGDDVEEMSLMKGDVNKMFISVADISLVSAYIINHGRPLISNWGGEWNNLKCYLDKDALVEVYDVRAQEQGRTSDDIMNELKVRYKSDVVAMNTGRDKLIFEMGMFCGEWVNCTGASIVYAYVKSMPAECGTWYVFEAESWWINPNEEDIEVYPIIMLSKVTGDVKNGDMRHFHFRYGNDADELYVKEGWLPTMVDSYQAELTSSWNRSNTEINYYDPEQLLSKLLLTH